MVRSVRVGRRAKGEAFSQARRGPAKNSGSSLITIRPTFWKSLASAYSTASNVAPRRDSINGAVSPAPANTSNWKYSRRSE